MSELQTIAVYVIFGGVVLTMTFDLLDMAVAALLGVSLLILFGVLGREELQSMVLTAGGPLALLFGGMVVAKVLEPTGVFEILGNRFLRLTRGSGKRFLLGLIILVAVPCAFLPNATTIVLLAPIIIRAAVALEVDFVRPMILAAIISNSAGMLTLVGDPATFLVGSAIGLSFAQYLKWASLGGVLALLVLIPLFRLLMKDTWKTRKTLPTDLADKPLERPWFCVLSLGVLFLMVALFLFGDRLPSPISPPAVAIVAATFALLILFEFRVAPVGQVLRGIDWSTLVFLACLFLMVEALNKTGVLRTLAMNLHAGFGGNLGAVAIAVLAGIGMASSLIPNIPVVAGTIFLVKGYFVAAELMPEHALSPTFLDWPITTLPVFVAMMFGATLGGNATVIGASANVVSAGICRERGQPIKFITFLRYGAPITLCQLAVSAVYVLVLLWLTRQGVKP